MFLHLGKLYRVPEGNRPRLRRLKPSRAKEKCTMSIEIRTVTVFTGTPTDDADRAHFKEYGFVHVTGLKVSGSTGYVVGEKLIPEHLGKYDYNNGVLVINTMGGEVWLRVNHGVTNLRILTDKFCPRGAGAFVPCSNGEQISTRDILQRIADPSYGLKYES